MLGGQSAASGVGHSEKELTKHGDQTLRKTLFHMGMQHLQHTMTDSTWMRISSRTSTCGDTISGSSFGGTRAGPLLVCDRPLEFPWLIAPFSDLRLDALRKESSPFKQAEGLRRCKILAKKLAACLLTLVSKQKQMAAYADGLNSNTILT